VSPRDVGCGESPSEVFEDLTYLGPEIAFPDQFALSVEGNCPEM
jgi:hypothetical protein